MEGVLVTVKQAGSKRATTVVTGRDGRYQFPRARLEPGSYGVSIRAIGYDLASEPTVSVAATGTHHREPDAAQDAQPGARSSPTRSGWPAFPGTDQQRASVRGCAHCHTLELVTRSKHNAESFAKVVERMAGYPPLAFPVDAAADARSADRAPAPCPASSSYRPGARQAEYLSTLNLGTGTPGATRSRRFRGRAAPRRASSTPSTTCPPARGSRTT